MGRRTLQLGTPLITTRMDRKQVFRLLAKLNKAILPRMWDKELTRLSKMQKAIVAWRIWVTKNAL